MAEHAAPDERDVRLTWPSGIAEVQARPEVDLAWRSEGSGTVPEQRGRGGIRVRVGESPALAAVRSELAALRDEVEALRSELAALRAERTAGRTTP